MGIALHVGSDPVQHQAYEHILVQRGDEGLILRPDGHSPGLLLHHALQQVVGQLVEIVLHLLPADGAIDVQNEGLILLHGLEDLQKALLPRLIGLFARQSAAGVLLTAPLHQIIDVLEVIVKRHAVDTAVIGDVADSDLVQGLFQQQLFQRRFQRPLGDL